MKHCFRYLIIALVALPVFANAQRYTPLLGEAYNSIQLHEWMFNFRPDSTNEEFNPYTGSYRVNHYKKGLGLDFNANMMLTGIELFDQGYSFEQFSQSLPFGAKWGMNIDSVFKSDKGFILVESNPFVLDVPTEQSHYRFFFTNDSLTSIRISAKPNVIERKAANAMANWGFRLLRNGKIMRGTCIEGNGVMSWQGGSAVYSGEWLFGLPHGYGIYQDTLGNEYEGMFKMGFFWGEGRLKAEDGSIYLGHFVMGKKHGYGKGILANSTRYEGEWFQNTMHGKGTFFFTKTNYYKGSMKYNVFDGYGELYTRQGVYKGQFQNNLPHGQGTQFSAGGSSLSGTWVKGKKYGTFTVKDGNGNTSKISFKNDQQVTR
jgi:hypothetical protein